MRIKGQPCTLVLTQALRIDDAQGETGREATHASNPTFVTYATLELEHGES